MNETKDVKLSSGPQILILDQAIAKIISIFSDTFLAAYFYKISEQNIYYLSLYNIVKWFIATVGAFAVGDFIKRKNKVKLYRFGIFLQVPYIFMIILLKEKIIDYVWLIGLMDGLTVSMIGFPFNMLSSEQVSNEERSKYLGYKSTATEIVSLLVPVLLGAYITASSYEVAAILILVFSILRLLLSFLIENKNMQETKMNLREFWTILKEDVTLKKLYFIEFLKGINRYGVMSLIVSLLIIYQTKNDLELGGWTSLFSLFTIIAMYLFGKYYKKNQKKKILCCSAIAILISFAGILFRMNKVTIILYNFVYYIFMNILLNITEVNLFDYSNKEAFAEKLNTEYFIFRELFLNIGRILRIFDVIPIRWNDAKSWILKYFVRAYHDIDYDDYSNE